MTDVPAIPPPVDAILLLCDSAQVADSKLYILGGGLNSIGPRPQPLAVAVRIQVPWDRANISHQWQIDLLDEDGHQVPNAEKAVRVGGKFEAGRPAGTKPGTPLSVPLAINFSTLPLERGHSYTWQLSIDGQTTIGWRTSFFVRS